MNLPGQVVFSSSVGDIKMIHVDLISGPSSRFRSLFGDPATYEVPKLSLYQVGQVDWREVRTPPGNLNASLIRTDVGPGSSADDGMRKCVTTRVPLTTITFSRKATIWLYLNIPAQAGAKQTLSF